MSRDAFMEPAAPVIDSERALLGLMLMDSAAVADVCRHLTPERMWVRAHQAVFRAIVMLRVAGKPVDLISLGHDLTRRGEMADIGGPAFLSTLLDYPTARTSVPHHASLVTADWQRRERLRLSRDLLSATHEPGLFSDHLQRIRELEESGSSAHGAWAEASLDLETVSRMDIPPTPSIAGPDGLLPVGGLVFLSGAPGSGKTFLALQLALAIASGGEWLGHTCTRASVGFLELEMNLASLRERIVRSSPHVGLDHIHALTQPRGGSLITDRDVRHRMVEWIRRHSLAVVFIDPFNRLQQDTGNPTKDARAELTGLHAIREETGATLILIHHIRKSPAGEKKQSGRVEAIQSMRGSAQYGDDADTMLQLDDRGDLRYLEWAKVRHARAPEPSWLARSESGFLHEVAPPEEAAAIRRADGQAGLLTLLAQAGPSGITVGEIVHVTGMNERTVRRSLNQAGAVKLPGFRGHGQRWALSASDTRQETLEAPFGQVSE